jgi:hypothetical protein
LIDIVISTLDNESDKPDAAAIRRLKRAAFGRILSQERSRLTLVGGLIDELEAELAGWE